jgi:hypothetical protein
MTSTTLVDAAAVAYTEQQEADRDVRNEHIAIVWNSMLEFFGLEGIDVLDGGETSTANWHFIVTWKVEHELCAYFDTYLRQVTRVTYGSRPVRNLAHLGEMLSNS